MTVDTSRVEPNLGTVPSPAKTATKTARPSPKNGNRLPLGAHPGNTGGKKGRSGRKPDAFKDFLKAEIRDHPDSRQALVDASRTPGNGAFTSAWKIATDYDDTKPAEKAQITGKLEIRVVIAREGRRVTAG